jgi:NAD(P)-dependent dehydrogenase (short-subunit alcohol dehydrogenase family)
MGLTVSASEHNPCGRVVIVTGAAGGIGRAIAQSLLADGHCIAAVDRDEGALRRLTDEFQEFDAAGRLHTIVCDLGLVRACEEAVDSAAGRFGRVEAVINNAGIGVSSLRPDAESRHPAIEELTSDIWDLFFAVNVRAPMSMVRAALPQMKAAGWGRIVNNTTSFLTMMRVLPYGATKAALEAMSAVWAAELAQTGITVNVLIPGGPTDTAFIGDGSGFARDRMLKPEIMGPPASWLLSDASCLMTGQRITAARWDKQRPPSEAAKASARAIGWPELGADVIWPRG